MAEDKKATIHWICQKATLVHILEKTYEHEIPWNLTKSEENSIYVFCKTTDPTKQNIGVKNFKIECTSLPSPELQILVDFMPSEVFHFVPCLAHVTQCRFTYCLSVVPKFDFSKHYYHNFEYSASSTTHLLRFVDGMFIFRLMFKVLKKDDILLPKPLSLSFELHLMNEECLSHTVLLISPTKS